MNIKKSTLIVGFITLSFQYSLLAGQSFNSEEDLNKKPENADNYQSAPHIMSVVEGASEEQKKRFNAVINNESRNINNLLKYIKKPAKIFPVCWVSFESSKNNLRRIVRDSVLSSWQKNANIVFSGWGECSKNSKDNEKYIRISWSKNGSSASSYHDTEGADVMIISNVSEAFCYIGKKNKGKILSLFECVKGHAVHEFGHVLKFKHEQSQNTIPNECKEYLDKTFVKNGIRISDDSISSKWDSMSPMSYCNEFWLNGILSHIDKLAACALYPYNSSLDGGCREARKDIKERVN